MSDTFGKLDPALLLEASRVLNAAGEPYRNIAVVVSELAKDSVKAPGKADAKIRAAILCDAVALRLSGRAPGGYEAALKLLDEVDPSQSEDNGARALILRALANGQKYKSLSAGAAAARDLQTIAARIAEDLAQAIRAKPENLDFNRHFWAPDAPPQATPSGRPGDPEDDLRLVLERETVVQDVIPAYARTMAGRRDPGTRD